MRTKKIIVKSVILILLAALLAFSLALTGCVPKAPGDTDTVFEPEYPATARHGYYSEYLGTVKRNIPTETKDGGLFAYPTYGRTLNMTAEQKNALIAESNSLCGRATANAGGGSYDKLDKDGYLYLSDGTPVNDANGNHRKLYKHTASVGMYFGDVSDDEPGVIKRITFKPRAYSGSYSITGLYAPAGEVVKVEVKKSDFDAANKSITIHIGQCLYNGQNNNIWAAKNFNRMAVVMSTLVLNEANSNYDAARELYTFYIGSYLGGPIYVRHMPATVTMTFSGAVNYRHFVLGYTSEADFEELKKSSAPYFDLEVWDNGVLHSGPLSAVKNFSYDDLYNAAVLWEKISLLSTNVRGQGIVNIYEPFVAAGAAVAFPGRASTNCPTGWMTNALNYNAFIKSGAWGVVHEYNHNFQGWGLAGGGEVTNNALNLASYISFTEISAARTLTASGMGGMSGWNAYTNAAAVLNQVMAGNYGGTNQLSIYATLMHNVGAYDFVRSAKRSGAANYYTDICNNTGLDMTYFFRTMCAQDPGDAAVAAIAEKGYPAFVPVASIYQTGRSLVDKDGQKRYITSMRPYVINYGEDFTFDISRYTLENGFYKSGSIVIPDGFGYTVKSVSAPEKGTLTKTGDNIYKYTPDASGADSGKIYVTLGITKNDNAFKVNDVELVFEFRQTREKNKSMLERTVYTYNEGSLPATAKEAYESNYAGYATKTDEDNTNRVQNSNTDIWEPKPASNAVIEIRGKLYVPTAGDYRVALRGRHSCALFLSADGGSTYEYAAKLDHNTNTNTFWPNDPDSYCDLTDMSAGDWIYFKEVLLVDYASAFVGLGWGKIEREGGVIEEGEEAHDVEPTVNLAYAAAYRSTYEFPDDNFKSDYLFTKRFNYSYDGSTYYPEKGTLISHSGYTPWQGAGYSDELAELFDDNDSNFIHSAKGAAYDVTPEQPFDITVDLGSVRKVNTMTIYGEPSRQYQPKDFELYGGTSQSDLRLIKQVTGTAKTGNNIVVSFDECELRYYRLVCTATQVSGNPTGSKYIAYRCIKFDNILKLPNGRHITPGDAAITYRGDWKIKNAVSNFGRIYEGGNGASCEFGFNGTRFGIGAKCDASYGSLEVYIDGALVETVSLRDGDGVRFVFVSAPLKDGAHSVKAVCKGKASIESVIFWGEA